MLVIRLYRLDDCGVWNDTFTNLQWIRFSVSVCLGYAVRKSSYIHQRAGCRLTEIGKRVLVFFQHISSSVHMIIFSSLNILKGYSMAESKTLILHTFWFYTNRNEKNQIYSKGIQKSLKGWINWNI